MSLFNRNLSAEDEQAETRQSDVRRLRDAIENAITGRTNAPIFLRECLKHEVWKHTRIFAGGTRQGPIGFDEFVRAPYPVGLGVDLLTLREFAADHPDIVALLEQAAGQPVPAQDRSDGLERLKSAWRGANFSEQAAFLEWLETASSDSESVRAKVHTDKMRRQ